MKKILVVILGIIAFAIISLCIAYNIGLRPVSRDNTEVEFMVESGSTYYGVINKLKEKGLIKNEFCFKLYVKFNNLNNIEAGTYKLRKNMSVDDIVKVFSKGNTYNPDAIVITFKEGKNMRWIANTISAKTNNTVDDVYSLLSDREYLNSLIEGYWFIDEHILDENIYYSLEGYLFPDTYEFKNKDVTVKEIFKVMLDQMDSKLNLYKVAIQESSYSPHEILTLASIIELECSNKDNKKDVSGVFYNRLNSNWSLGSDVTTYYAAKVDLNERDLYAEEIEAENYYNTRSSFLSGRLPIGPICSPSIESIIAALYPEDNDYYYFVSDKNGKIYFSKTYQQHIQTREDLINSDLWYTYE